MRRKIIALFLILALIPIICSCKAEKASDLKFHVISRSFINNGMTDKEIMSAVAESGRLVFDGDDLMGYNWQSHTVVLDKDSIGAIGTVTAEKGGSALFKVDDSFAFVLSIGNELIYTGGFTPGTKSPDIPLQPSIKDESRYTFSIRFDSKYADFQDNRANTKLYTFLEKQGLLSTKTN